jgi:response regulator RpfG family c-di-GMP phosphodiesterase/ribonuclease BN (tRNA processing enzyme)
MKRADINLDSNELLEMIFNYFIELSSTQDHKKLITILAAMARNLTLSDRCTIWIVDDTKENIISEIAEEVGMLKIPYGVGIVGSAIENNEIIIIDDAYSDKRFHSQIDKETGYKTKNMLVVPMCNSNGEAIGAIQVMNKRKGSFHEDDVTRLLLSSTFTAETIIAAKLQLEIENTQKEIIFLMGAVGESRSKETANHVKRVAEYSKFLALAYGLDEKEAEMLKYASPMHDIGKVAIPDHILNKPSYLNRYEKRIMDSHTTLGYELIKNSKRPLLQAAAIVAHQHHEKWDGSGYPQGLKGKDIHIFGRITALADVFDALGSDRIYKKAWSDEDIFEYIKKEKGKHFEPRLVELFFQNRDKIFEIRNSFKDEFREYRDKNHPNTIKILGAYGTKASGYGTISIALNKDSVIDAGNLLDTLQDASVELANIWITHSHLDHIVEIAYILDNYFTERKKTLCVYGLPETIRALQENFFNDIIWPDFSKISLLNSNDMVLKYKVVHLEQKYQIAENEFLEPFATDHTVVSCGYLYTKQNATIMIATDTYSIKNIIKILEEREEIKALIIECSFPNKLENLAKESKHLTPKLLFDQLNVLNRRDITIYINHMKPMCIDQISQEIEQYRAKWQIEILKDEEFLYF